MKRYSISPALSQILFTKKQPIKVLALRIDSGRNTLSRRPVFVPKEMLSLRSTCSDIADAHSGGQMKGLAIGTVLICGQMKGLAIGPVLLGGRMKGLAIAMVVHAKIYVSWT